MRKKREPYQSIELLPYQLYTITPNHFHSPGLTFSTFSNQSNLLLKLLIIYIFHFALLQTQNTSQHNHGFAKRI